MILQQLFILRDFNHTFREDCLKVIFFFFSHGLAVASHDLIQSSRISTMLKLL